jgi:hypothetical protein
MNAHRMVCHLIDALASSFAPSPQQPGAGILAQFPMKQLAIYWLPWPKGKLRSPPDLLMTQPTDWDRDLQQLRAVLERVAARGEGGDWPASEVFGRLTGRQWGALLRSHINHHLEQFGA